MKAGPARRLLNCKIVPSLGLALVISAANFGQRGPIRNTRIVVLNPARSRASLRVATISATFGQSPRQNFLATDRPGCPGSWDD
jgi:hypothetical protein